MKLLLILITLFLIDLKATTVLGDSIAVGIKQVNPKYNCYAKIGITSSKFNRVYSSKIKKDDKYIISLGSNDPHDKNLKNNLIHLRRNLSGEVIWVIPQNTKIPLEVAKMFGDKSVTFKASRDKIHPKNYTAFKGL